MISHKIVHLSINKRKSKLCYALMETLFYTKTKVCQSLAQELTDDEWFYHFKILR